MRAAFSPDREKEGPKTGPEPEVEIVPQPEPEVLLDRSALEAAEARMVAMTFADKYEGLKKEFVETRQELELTTKLLAEGPGHGKPDSEKVLSY